MICMKKKKNKKKKKKKRKYVKSKPIILLQINNNVNVTNLEVCLEEVFCTSGDHLSDSYSLKYIQKYKY